MANPKLCAICGVMRATTRDHVPPRSIFPKPLPVEMITVPACQRCNQGAAVSDEAFRVYLGATTAYYDDDATRAWKEGAIRTLSSNRRLMEQFARGFGEPVRLPDGREGIPIVIPADMYRATCERIVRGLFYHHLKIAPGQKMRCEVHPLTGLSEDVFSITGDWNGGSVGTSAFVYRFGYTEDLLRSLWIFQFFNSHWAAIETYPRDGTPLAAYGEALQHSLS